jgi:hypothetical protein
VLIHGLAATREIWRHVVGLLRAWVDPEEGHFLFRRRLPDVLGAVTGAGAASGAWTTAV